MIAAVGAWFGSTWAKVGVILAGVAAALAVALEIMAKLMAAGRADQRAIDAANVAKRTRMATQARIEAMKPVSPQVEAADPYNRDRQ